MKEEKFIKENIKTWTYLENTLKTLKSKGFKRISGDDLNNFISAYNTSCGHLSYSRTYYGNSKTTEYLNRLVASAHGYIYAVESSHIKKMLKFFFNGFPLLIKKYMGYFAASTALFLFGMLVSFVFIMILPDNAPAFIPQDLIEGINNFDSTSRAWDNAITSGFIMTNNIKVSLIAFVLGITLGIGTCYVLIVNGFMLGGAAALAYQKGISSEFWAMILPHGVFELFAIFVGGAAGLLIAKSIISPGIYSRKDSLIKYGKTAIYFVCCTIPILVVAGTIEGYFTPSSASVSAKLIFSLAMLLILVFYLLFPVFWSNRSKFKSAS